MTLRNFIARLNCRQILIHFVATWFLIHGVKILSYLFDIGIVDIVRHRDHLSAIDAIRNSGRQGIDIMNFLLWTELSGFAGLLIAFIISLAISIKNKWFWVNSFIVLIVAYLLYRFDLLGWNLFRSILLAPGQLFENSTLEFLTNGLLLSGLGLLTFFLRMPNRFISKANLLAA